MTGFAVTGAIYDTTNVNENVKAFRAMSIILMVSRLALVIQYGAVLWYLRKYQNTVIPLLVTMAALFVAAMAFLGTFFGFKTHGPSGDSKVQGAQPTTYIAWYVLVCVEAAAVIAASCVWRVVSFKRTHLVERVGLLTLIILGEGIFGMTKSVSRILQSSRSTTGSDVGVIMSSVLLIVGTQCARRESVTDKRSTLFGFYISTKSNSIASEPSVSKFGPYFTSLCMLQSSSRSKEALL